jgi:hypothetical protein
MNIETKITMNISMHSKMLANQIQQHIKKNVHIIKMVIFQGDRDCSTYAKQ